MTTPHRHPADDEELLLRAILRLVDVDSDIQRNENDHHYALTGGRIDYVFDASVFEVFIDPKDPRGYATSLHAPLWNDLTSSEPQVDREIAWQSALLTSEYVLSGKLPGQIDPRILMTTWHREELARRHRHLIEKYHNHHDVLDQKKLKVKFTELRDAYSLYFSSDRSNKLLSRLSEQLRDDVALIKAAAGNGDSNGNVDDASLRYIATRLLLRALANDDHFEPAEQLIRIAKQPLRGRLSTLAVPVGLDTVSLETIRKYTRIWLAALKDECQRRGISVVEAGDNLEPGTRTRGALLDDAKTLGFLEWLSVSRVKDGERLVFVTADNLLFDTYRRTYIAHDERHAATVGPFILRRMSQYSPAFNLSDSRSVLTRNTEEMFVDLRSTLEALLLVINLSRRQYLVSGQDQASRRRAARSLQKLRRLREDTGLRGTVDDPVAQDVSYRPLVLWLRSEPSARTNLRELIVRWRRLERAALGVADAQIRSRLSGNTRMQSILQEFKDIPPSRSEEVYTRYFERLVHDLRLNVNSGWLPLSQEFIERWVAPDNADIRATVAFELYFNADGQRIDIAENIARRLAGEDGPIVPDTAWPHLFENSREIVFAIASCLALAVGSWRDAFRYSRLALWEDENRLLEARSGSNLDATLRSSELAYLNALAIRFRIGDIGPAFTKPMLDRVLDYYTGAVESLERTDKIFRTDEPSVSRGLRVLRTSSERLALHIFVAIVLSPEVARSLPMPAAVLRSRNFIHGDRASAIRALLSAIVELGRFSELSVKYATDFEGSRWEGQLRQQVAINGASVAVMRALFSGRFNRSEFEDIARLPLGTKELVDGVRDCVAHREFGSEAMYSLEAFVFLWVFDQSVSRDRVLEILGRRRAYVGAGDLRVDFAVMRALKSSSELFL